MENNNEITALTNSLNFYKLEGYKIHEYYQQDKRIKNKLYFLTDEKGKSLTGYWRYIEINHFIHGYGEALKTYDKLKEDNAAMLNILQRINNVISIPAVSKVFSHDLQIAIKKATKQAENK